MVVIDKNTITKISPMVYKQFNMAFRVLAEEQFNSSVENLEYVIIDRNDFFCSDSTIANTLGDSVIAYGFSMCPFYDWDEMINIVKIKNSRILATDLSVTIIYALYVSCMKFCFANQHGFIGSLKPIVSELINVPDTFDFYLGEDGLRVIMDGKKFDLEDFVRVISH